MLGFNSVGVDKATIFSEYKGPLPIRPLSHELPFCICRSDDLSQSQANGEEHDARDLVRLYK